MKPKKIPSIAIIALVITALALTLTTAAVLSTSQNVPLNGTINAVNIGVYSDSECTQTVTALNVGTSTQAEPPHKQSTSKTQATFPRH